MPRLRRALAAVAATASLLTVGTVLPAMASPAPAGASADGSYTLSNGASGQCAADNGGFTTPGTTVIQWPCPSSVNLDWRVTELLSGAYTLTSVNSGLLLTTASTANGAPVTQQPDTGSALQQWTIE